MWNNVVMGEKMKLERTKNTIRNMIWGFINKIMLIVFPFLARTVIIKKLGTDYLGLGSLFTSILQVLNLTELGFTSAIVYSLYKPIAENNKEKICALMNYYKKIYNRIAIIILIIGMSILPFLKNLINGEVPNGINIYILYVIYLGNTIISYSCFAYKTALLTSNQRNDIISNINSILCLIQYILQIALIYFFENYYIYIIILPIITMANNVICAIIAKKKYPEYICKGEIEDNDRKDIKKRVKGLMIIKLCRTTRNSLDSIFISTFFGLTMVAIYNNYYIIMSSIKSITEIITTAMFSGVGNSLATESVEKNYNDMIKFDYIYMWIIGWCSICLLCLYQPFMKLWLGAEFLLPFGIVILLVLYFYSLKMGDIKSMYLETAGLWWESRYRAIIETILNIILNILLGKIWGLYGIVAGTLISLLIINFGFGSQIVFKYYFKNGKLKNYFLYHLKYFIITAIIAIVTLFLCYFIKIEGIIGLLLKFLICLFIPNIIYFCIYYKTKDFKNAKQFIVNILKRK